MVAIRVMVRVTVKVRVRVRVGVHVMVTVTVRFRSDICKLHTRDFEIAQRILQIADGFKLL